MSTDTAVTAIPPVSFRSEPDSAPTSPPKDRVKFFCSHGGKILPRPADGQLKYVGGENRVISVPRDISYLELMKRLTYLIDGEMILKYQLMSEDLDALVSVKSDEDLRLMFEEIDHYKGAGGSPRLRVFLFPQSPVVIESPSSSVEHYAPEQRYIDSINGIIRPTPLVRRRPTFQVGSLTSSACTSPSSPDSTPTETTNVGEFMLSNHRKGGLGMHRVRSSPSICNLNASQQSNQPVHQFHPHYYQNYRQPYHLASYQSPKPPIDSNRSGVPERMFSIGPAGRVEGARNQADVGPQLHHYAFKKNRGNDCCTRLMHYDGGSHFSDRRVMDRSRSLVTSPIMLSPPKGQSGMRAWDGTIGG